MDAALSHRGAVLLAALASYALIAAGYLMLEVPGLGIGHLFYLPIVLVALVTGPLLGAGAGALATLLYVLCVILNHRIPSADVLTASTAIRAVTFVAGGVLIGTFAARNRALVERLRELADRDFLTGLLNNRSFEAGLHRRCAGARRFAILLADLDGLKETNDRDGHAAGNALLRAAAAGLEDAVRGPATRSRGSAATSSASSPTSSRPRTRWRSHRGSRRSSRRAASRRASAGRSSPSTAGRAISLYRRADERLYASKNARKASADVVSLLRPAGR